MKRRSFLGALAAVFAAPKLLEAKPDPVQESINTPWPHPPGRIWNSIPEEPGRDAYLVVQVCWVCGRECDRMVPVALPPSSGVAALSDGDYLPRPTSPTFTEMCRRCVDDLRDSQ